MFKNKKEFIKAMMKGRKFTAGMGVCYYDENELNPFRFIDTGISEPIYAYWDNFSIMEEIKEWYQEIPKKGVICMVWGDQYKKDPQRLRVIIDYDLPKFKGLFKTTDNSFWSNAEPVDLGDYV